MAQPRILSTARTFCIDVARRILPAPLVARARSLAVRRLKGDARQVFTQIHDKNIWGYDESVSGAGSTLRYTESLRKTLPALLAELGIQSMLDLPCGDFHWMAQVDLPVRQYIGADIVEPLIARNQAAHGGSGGARGAAREFRVIDLSKDALPKVDLLFCRDCLMHLSEALIIPCLENMRRSEITWLLTTTYEGTQNRAIRTGDWFPINLTAEPYNFPAPLRKLDDWIPPFDRRHLALWKIADLNLRRPQSLNP